MSTQQEPAGIPSWDLADRLHKALRHAGLKPGDMAAHLDVHRNTIGGYLRGKTPNRATLISWAMKCGVPFTWLAYGIDEEGGDGGATQGVSVSRCTALSPGGTLLRFPAREDLAATG